MSPSRQRLAAVWFADITGYSALATEDEGSSVELARLFQGLARREIERHGGRVVKFLGDGVFAEFPSAADAVGAALDLRRAYERTVEAGLAEGHALRFGVHLGEVFPLPDGDLHGGGVNVAARLVAEARAGEILASEAVRGALGGRTELRFEERGERVLKGIGPTPTHAVESAAPLGFVEEPRRRRGNLRLWAGLALGTFVLSILLVRAAGLDPSAAWVGLKGVARADAEPVARSIAVLPFADRSPGGYLGPALTDELIERLTRIGDFTVIASGSAGRSAGRTPAEAGRLLGVATILEGGVEDAGGRILVRARLVDARADTVLWEDSFERDSGALGDLRDDIAARVVSALRLEVDPAVATAVPRGEGAAYVHYLQARYHWNRRTEEGIRKSIDLFRRALDEDPAYAPAYAGLASAYLLAGSYAGFSRAESERWARSAAERALELDPGSGEAHAVLGQVAFKRWEWETAEREFRRAIELSPGSATAHHWYALYLADMGRFEEAHAHFDRAERLDPLSLVIVTARSAVYAAAGDYDRGIAQCGKALDLDPAFEPARGNLVELYLMSGRYEEAVAAARASGGAVRADPDGLEAALRRGGPEALLGAFASASEAAGAPAFVLAGFHAAMGDREGALGWLEESYRRREPELAEIRVHPWLGSLREEPRYRRIAEEMGLGTGPS